MKAVKLLATVALCSFAAIALLGVIKKKKAAAAPTVPPQMAKAKIAAPLQKAPVKPKETGTSLLQQTTTVVSSSVDRIDQLFAVDGKKLPIVETITYTSHASWLPGKPAWVSDYASHFETSRHFIARSLNKSRDYFSQKVREGDRFNVLRSDKPISFYLVVSINQSKMLFYYYDATTHERVLLKTYSIGLGRRSEGNESGCLTPLGTFELGDRIAIYKPSDMGTFQQKPTEMIRVFGTRWIPFGNGYGIHGAPWIQDEKKKELVEMRSSIGQYESDGCIRLLTEDVEELFAIVITKPTTITIVKNFSDAKLPGKEINP